jgi:hypothetical protein
VRLLAGSRTTAAAVVAAGSVALAGAAPAQVPPAQQISVDPFGDPLGQHETGVEPDSFSFGDTVVAVFQVGRMVEGGASGIGWASSANGGRTWRSGVLPALTEHGSPPGPFTRASDPVVAYDRVHGVWLANALALRDLPGVRVSSLVVSRSTDAVNWSSPVVVSPEVPGQFTHDKNWIVCDNGASSPNAGRCYVVWTRAHDGAMAVSTSVDGGSSWSAGAVVPQAVGSGWQPVVRPDGTLVVVYEGSASVEAVRSTDGGSTFGPRIRVSALRAAGLRGMRTPSLPSVEVDGAGTVYAAWHDCRFRVGCEANDVVMSSSADGTQWSRTRRVPTSPALRGVNHFVTGLGVDSSTRGAETRLGVAFYASRCIPDACSIQPYFVSSATAGRTWSAPEALAPQQPTTAYPETAGGRFAGDYISTSFASGGTAVPVFAAATAPFDGRFHQGVFASVISPLPAVTRAIALGPVRVTRTRTRLTARSPLTGDASNAVVSCRLRGIRARILVARVAGSRATCVWRVASRARASGTIGATTPEGEASRSFNASRGRWAAARGNYRTLVILATWGPEPFPREDVRRTVFDESDTFLRRSSFGQVSLSGDVTTWLPAFTSEPTCPAAEHERVAPALADPMQRAARAAGFEPDSYARLVYVHPRMQCPWNAVGVRREVLLNGVLSPWVVVHELGHTFELAHAYGTACDANGCRHDEYGDPFSPMGRGLVDFSAYEKVKLGWIPNPGRFDARGRYELGRPDVAAARPHALVVPTGSGDYWFEQRLDVSPPGLAVRRVEPDVPDDDLEAPTRFVRDPQTGADVVRSGGTFRQPGVFQVVYEAQADGSAILEFWWADTNRPARPKLVAPGRRVRAGRPIRIAWRPTPDRGSGIRFCTLTVDRQIVSSNDAISVTVPALRRGRHGITVTCTDRAGNRSLPVERIVTAR